MNNFEKIKWNVDINKLTIDEAKKIMIEASYNGNPLNLSLYQMKQYLQTKSKVSNEQEWKVKQMEYENLIERSCKIIPFENLTGTIIGVYITKKGVEYQVRYYSNFEQKTEYFFGWELLIEGLNR